MEDLYILDGVELTYDQVNANAEQADMDFTEYVIQNGIQKKEKEKPEKVEQEQDIVKIQEWNPTESAEYYESLPMMDKDYAAYQDWKEKNARQLAKDEANEVGINLSTEDPSVTSKFETTTKPYLERKRQEEVYDIVQETSFEEFNEQYKPKNKKVEENLNVLDNVKPEVSESGFKIVGIGAGSTGDIKQDIYSDNDDVKNYAVATLFPETYEVKGGGYDFDSRLLKKDRLTGFVSENPDEVLRPIIEADISRGGEQVRYTVNKQTKRNQEQEYEFIEGQLMNLKTTPEILEFYKDPTKVVGFEELKKGFDKGRFTKDQREIYEEYKATGSVSPETAEKYNRKKLNLGEKLFDEKGDLININYSAEEGFSKEESDAINDKAKKYQEKAPTVEELKKQMSRIYYELMYVDKKIANNKQSLIDNATGGIISGPMQTARDFISGGETLTNPINATDFALNNELSFNSGKIAGTHPLAVQHNELIIELMALNQALKLNSNLMTIEEDDTFRFAKQAAAGIFLGGDVTSLGGPDDYYGIGSTEKAAGTLKTVFESAGLELDPTVMSEYDVNELSIGEKAVDVTANMMPLLYSIAAAKGTKVKMQNGKSYGLKPTLDKLDAYNRLRNRGRGPVITKVNNLLNGIAKEILTFAAANEYMTGLLNQEETPMQDAVFFGFGNSTAAGVSKFLATKYMPFFSKFARTKLGVGLSAAGRPIVGGVTATTVGKFAEAGNLAIQYFNGADDQTIEQGLEHLTEINNWYADIVAFTALGIRGNIYNETRNNILAVDTRSQRTIDAAKQLGIKEFSSNINIDKALQGKLKELGVDKMNLAQMNNKQNKANIDKLKLAAETLKSQNAAKEAKGIIEANDKWWESSGAKLDIAAKKIAMGEKLNLDELETIQNFGEIKQKNGQVNTSLNIPITKDFNPAAIVMYDRLQNLGANLPSFEQFKKSVVEQGSIATDIYQMAAGNTKQAKANRKLLLNEYSKIESEAREIVELDQIIKTSSDPVRVAFAENAKKRLVKSRNESMENWSTITEKALEGNKDLVNKDINFWKPISEKLGVEFKVMDDKTYKTTMSVIGGSKTSEGFYAGGRVYINKDRAAKAGAVSVATHEMIHALIMKSFVDKSGKVTAEGKEVLDDFYNSLSTKDKAEIDRRVKGGNYTEQQKYNEYLTLFSDGSRRGRIKFNEGFLNSMTNLIGKMPGVKNKGAIDLTTKEGVVDFLKILDNSYKKGELDSRIYEFWETQKEKPEPTDFTAASENATLNDLALKYKKDPADPSIDVVDMLEQYQNVALKAIGYVENKGFRLKPKEGQRETELKEEFKVIEREDVIGDVNQFFDKVLTSYDPTKLNAEGKPLTFTNWVFNNLSFKKADIYEKYIGQKAKEQPGFDTKVMRPEPITGEGRTGSLELLNDVVLKRVKLKAEDKLSEFDTPEKFESYLNAFKNPFLELPDLGGYEAIALEVGIPENKVSDPKDNLSGPEARKAQMWMVRDNHYNKAQDLMPFHNVPAFKEYAYNAEGKRVKHPKARGNKDFIWVSAGDQNILNAPTGIKGNIQKAFFEKTPLRFGVDKAAGVHFLWTKKDFSTPYFLEQIGIKDLRRAEGFTQRSSEAQTLKGVLRYMADDVNLRLYAEKAEQLGLKNKVQDLRSAKNIYAASSTAISKLEPSKRGDFLDNKISDIAKQFEIRYGGLPTTEAEVKAVVKEILRPNKESIYTAKEVNDLSKAMFNSLKVSELEIQRNKETAGRIEATNIENTVKNYFEESLLANNETITENVLGIANGVLASENRLFNRQEKQRDLDSGWWSHSMEKATDKFQAAVDLASIGREQFTNSSTIGDKRYMYHGGTAKWNSRLNEVLFDYGFKLENNKVVDIKTGESREASGIGSAFHNSEKALKLMEEAIKNGKLDYSSPKVKEVYEQYDQVSQKARKLIADQMEYIVTQFKEGRIDNIDLGLRTMNLKSGMGSALRLAAPLRGIYIPLPGEKLLTKNSIVIGKTKEGKVIREKLLVWEHNKSAEQFLLETLKIYMNESNTRQTSAKNKTITLNKKGKEALDKVYENFYVNIIPHTMDVMVKDRGYQVFDPLTGTRYYNSKTFQDPRNRAYYDIKNDVIVGGAWANAAENALNPVLAKENLKADPIFAASETNIKTNAEFLDAATKHDKALNLAKKVDKPVKKIRIFDFDDTMAKTKSLVFYNRPSQTTNVKPKLKAIVMAGTPGGGKSSVIKGLGLVKDGFKEVNQDISLEWLKTKEGLPAKEADYTKEQKSIRSKLGAEARKIAARKLDKFSKQGNGIILDGTGASLKATESKVQALEELGYEVSMIYVDTPKETAIARNQARAERSLPDFIVEKTWDAVNKNREVYAGRFGDKFYQINTEGLKQGEVPKDISDAIKRDLAATERGRLNAEEFAKEGKNLVEEGFKMDFSDFNIVREGERGPLFEVAEKIRDARGTEDVFILTARAPESARAIHEFLKSEGLDIPIENITGLGNSTGEAKAQWIIGKAAEGYNDFYFADDALANVKAVKEALAPLDVKSKVQQAYASESEVKSLEFNKLLEQSTGIEYYKEYSAAKAKTVGANKGKFKFWIPYSAEDFTGLIYPTLTKGKLGDKQMAWYKTNLLNPYARAMDNLSRDRVQLMQDFKALKKQLDVPKDLRKTNESGFTNEQAVRVYLYEKSGYETPGLSKTDKAELLDIVNSNGKLQAFAEQILSVTKGDGYAKPGENWLVGTITTDLIDLLNTTKRKKYLEEWQSNVDQIYSKENLNKLEAIYGPKYREALENSLSRMKAGKNRLTTGNRLSNQVLDYINGSNAAIMFFNTRSAVLQTISSINFVNWSFNNPIKAGAAFANQPQYWKDFTKLMNSDYLLDRRNGLRLNIAESEIADAAATSKNKVKGAIKYILEKGYLPTQYADSFAIASGGATFYRNRINDLVKKGVSVKEAEAQALLEWRQIAEESQQSSDPSKISQQQSSDAGRLILMFANTPMQYARLQKRAFQDLVNGRGDAKANVSKIAYYGFVQNIIFNALQQAVFKLGFDDEDNDVEKEKTYFRTANGMLDTTLRGLGIGGAAVSVAKNFLLDIYERSGRKRPEYVDSMWKLLQFSPPISSKISKLRQAAYAFDSKKRRQEIFDKGFSLDNPAAMAGAKVISATTNIPLDRILQKVDNVQGALSEEADWWQTTAMLGGWPRWSIMPDRDEYVSKPKTEEEKQEIKENRKKDKYKAAQGSTDFETIKALTKAQQEKMLKDLGYGSRAIKNAKTEADRIKLIQEANKNP